MAWSRILLVLVLFSCQTPKVDLSFQPSEALDVMQDQLGAWNRGDIDGFMEGYWKSDSLQFVTSRGLRQGWEQVRQGYHKSYPTVEKMGHLTFDYERVEWADDRQEMLYILGRWRVNESNDPLDSGHSGWFHLTFKGFQDGPRIVADHTW